MMRKTLIHSILIVAASAALALPGAHAMPESEDFPSRSNSTDGAKVFANIPDGPKAAATPKKAAKPRYQEAQRKTSSGGPGFTGSGASAPQVASPQVRPRDEWADDWGH